MASERTRPRPSTRSDLISPSEEVRERLIGAMTRAAAERGYANTTVEDALRYAGISETTFYEHFSGKDQCLIAASEAFFERILADLIAATKAQSEWPAKVNAAVGAALTFLSESLSVARLFMIEIRAIGPAVAEFHSAAARRIAALLRTGRDYYPAAATLPRSNELIVIAGAIAHCSLPLLAEEADPFQTLQSELVEVLLTPYIGSAEAKRVAHSERLRDRS